MLSYYYSKLKKYQDKTVIFFLNVCATKKNQSFFKEILFLVLLLVKSQNLLRKLQCFAITYEGNLNWKMDWFFFTHIFFEPMKLGKAGCFCDQNSNLICYIIRLPSALTNIWLSSVFTNFCQGSRRQQNSWRIPKELHSNQLSKLLKNSDVSKNSYNNSIRIPLRITLEFQ